MQKLNEYSLESVPNKAVEKVYIDGICLGVIETPCNVDNAGYHVHVGKSIDYVDKDTIPFELRSVYGFTAPIDAANYLYKLYLTFKP